MTSQLTHADGLKIKGYAAIREFALGFPEAAEEFPWGHCAIKVRKKIFVMLAAVDDGFTMSLKLKDSNFEALLLPFTQPTHYGMGKHGWVTSRFGKKALPPMPVLRAWIEESFRAIAPKTVVKQLDETGLTPPPKARTRRKVTKKTVRKPATAKKKVATRKAPGAKSSRKKK